MDVLVNPLSCGRMEEKPRNTQLETDRIFGQMATR
jgi:hypothetical protein